MAVVTRDQLKAQLNFTDDLGEGEDALLDAKIAAAQSFIERGLGYEIDPDNPPADLAEAVLQLAAWWYENRETAGDGAKEVPFGVSEIIRANRNWSF